MTRSILWRVVAGSGLAIALAGAGSARAAERTPVVATPHFAFYSDFETNLNDALIAAGLARTKSEQELFRAGEEAACFAGLAPPQRAAWNAAVGWYAEVVSPTDWTDRRQFLIRMQLVGFDAEWRRDAAAEPFVELARGFRTVAAPAYRACRWAAQDANNRRWIEEMKLRLDADGARIAARLEQLYQKRWQTLPILVDVVETVNWSGANSSWSDAGQGDLLIANEPRGAAGFETMFHEASHVLMDRGDPVRRALERAAEAAGFPLPRDLWHVVLFFTTGEAVRPIVDEREAEPYQTMLYAILSKGTWAEYRSALERAWRPYVDGRCTLDESAAELISALREKPR